MSRRAALFFDRDGTLTVDHGYTYRPNALAWMPGAIEAVKACNAAGWLAIVVTNQSGLARGMFTVAQMTAFHDAMQASLAAHGARIDAFYFCPYHEDGVVEAFKIADHPDRKPNPGMLRRAMLEWSIDPARSFMVGDTAADMAAGHAAGVRAAMVRPGELEGAVRAALASPAPPGDDPPATAMLQARAEIARRWLFDHAGPVWWARGFDRESRIFHERLGLDGAPVLGAPRRVRVQARQTYVYAALGRLGWPGPWRDAVEAGAAVLLTRGLRRDGGTAHALSPDGAVADARRDLYDAAFVAFALAHAAAALPDRADLGRAASDLLDWVDTHWALPDGGYYEGELTPAPPRRQNPHMHLFEARLAAFEATGDAAHLAGAERIAGLFAASLFDAEAGALREYYDDSWRPMPGDAGRIVEPGHHFEWSWLLHRLADAGGADLRAQAERLRVHAEVYGVETSSGVTFDEIDVNGAARARTSRLWPHTERLKANLARFERTADPAAVAAAAQAFDVLQTYLATPTPGLWRDRRLPDGHFVEEAAPASSFYHIALAYSELIRIAALT